MKCSDCKWFRAGDQKDKGNCFYDPPKVQFMPVEIPVNTKGAIAQPGQPQTTFQNFPFSAVPMVRDVDFCHHFTTKDEGKPH